MVNQRFIVTNIKYDQLLIKSYGKAREGVNVIIDHKITSYDPKFNPDENLHVLE